MQNKHYDEHTLYIESGVAKEEQIAECLKVAVLQANKYLKRNTNCRFQINLIMKDGQYVGHGYVRISCPEVYWMMLGFNPDGSERIEEIPDPNWVPSPSSKSFSPIDDFDVSGFGLKNAFSFTQNQKEQKQEKKSWYDLTIEEDSKIQPMVKRYLPPLVKIPGYAYDEEQTRYLKSIHESFKRESEYSVQDLHSFENSNEREEEIPTVGHFVISRAFAYDPVQGYMKYRLCAKNVPDWVPEKAFKAIFSAYASDPKKVGFTNFGKKEVTDTYPIVNLIRKDPSTFPVSSFKGNDSSSKSNEKNKGGEECREEGVEDGVGNKKKGNIVLISFDPNNNDAIFALLMTRKLKVVHPTNPALSCVLHFNHAYDPRFPLY